MLVAFGSTKISRRTPAQSAMAPAANQRTLAKNHRAEFLFTVLAAWGMSERRKAPAETSQVAKAKTRDVAAVRETRAAPAREFGKRLAAEADRKRGKGAGGETQPLEFVAVVPRVQAVPARWQSKPA